MVIIFLVFFPGELEKSEFLLHIALKLAQDLQVEASITLVVAQNVVKVGLNRKITWTLA